MRAQTTLDFAIGTSIFLVVVVSVLAFVPGIFASFDRAEEAHTVTADRVASNLAEGQLVARDSPYVLDTQCTVSFFNESNENTDDDGIYSHGSNCRFADVSFDRRIGVADRTRVNVTAAGDLDGDGTEDVLCHDGDDDRFVETAHADCGPSSEPDTLLRTGPSPPDHRGSVTVARRVVHLDGHPVRLLVRVW